VTQRASVLPSAARGDTFQEADEVTDEVTLPTPSNTAAPVITASPTPVPTQGPSPSAPPSPFAPPSAPPSPPPPPSVEPDAAACSGRPFDAFLQLKNGSIYTFRGKL